MRVTRARSHRVRRGIGSLVIAAGMLAGSQALAQEGLEKPDVSESVMRAVAAPYLSDDERADLRVFHGMWTERDIADPRRRAKAALMMAVWDDASLLDDGADAEDRAEAAMQRGEYGSALEVLAGVTSLRGARLRAESLEALGRAREADVAIDPVVSALTRNQTDDAAELHEGALALRVRARLEGRPAGDFHGLMRLFGRAYQDLDRLYWPALVSEARLLKEKGNWGEAQQAAQQAMTLNPTCVPAAALLGSMAVESFSFDQAQQIASELDRMARRIDVDPAATSPLGELIRARAWIRQNEPDLAQYHLDTVLERYPLNREALALSAACEALRYEPERVERMLAEFDRLSPGSAQALYEIGRTLSDARQYEPAAEYLRRAAELAPNWPEVHIELGLLEMQSGRDEEAVHALRRATKLDEFNVRAANSLKLIEELLTYERLESEHFVVRFKGGDGEAGGTGGTGGDGVLAREMAGPLEALHEVVTGELGFEPDRKTVIELLPNHEWFSVRITGMPDVHTIAAATGPVIAMESPREGAGHKVGEYDWPRVLQHEYTHTVTLAMTRNRIPHWFTEAAAVHLEYGPRDYSRCQLLVDALMKGTLFDMRQINVGFTRGDMRPQAYAQGHWMYEFILDRWGPSAPIELMDRYAEGLREDDAMCEVLGLSQEEFHERFKVWAEDDAQSWGLTTRPTIEELRLEETQSLENMRERTGADLAALATMSAGTLAGWRGINERMGYAPDLVDVSPAMIGRWLEAYPEHPGVLELRLKEVLEAKNGKADESVAPLLERYAAARPVDPAPHRLLAQVYLASGDKARAIPHLEYLDAREQYSAAYAAELARRYGQLGDYERSRRSAERATRIGPFNANYRELAATVAIRLKDWDTAERHLRALVDLEPTREVHKRRLEALAKMREGTS